MCRNLPSHYIYPAIIEQAEDNYCLYFPDLPGCVASGDTVERVVELAQEAAQEYCYEARCQHQHRQGVFVHHATSCKERYIDSIIACAVLSIQHILNIYFLVKYVLSSYNTV